MGWLGVAVESYHSDGRFSAFGGLGYTPEYDQGVPAGPTFAAGIRAYTLGIKHRVFAELSVFQVAIRRSIRAFVEESVGVFNVMEVKDGKRYYGPGLQVGYQYVTAGGFTFVVSAGAGHAFGVADRFLDLLNLGLGYTWRRP